MTLLLNSGILVAFAQQPSFRRDSMPNTMFRIPRRELGSSPISIHVEGLGNLRISKGRVVWRDFGRHKGTKISWDQLAEIIKRNGVPE